MIYLALIGDLIASKTIPRRREFQSKFIELVEGLNSAPWRRDRDLVSPFTVTLGDELQALYADPTNVMLDVWDLASHLAPVALRVSLAIGGISTRTNPEAAIGMDGPVFHIARYAIENTLKANNLHLSIASAMPGVETQLEDATARLVGQITAAYKPTRLRILALAAQDRKPAEIATDPAVDSSVQNVYRHLRSGAVAELAAVGRALGISIERLLH